MKAIVKRLLQQARVIESDDPGFAAAPREDFVETMWSDEERERWHLDRDNYLLALRQTWRRFYSIERAQKRLREYD